MLEVENKRKWKVKALLLFSFLLLQCNWLSAQGRLSAENIAAFPISTTATTFLPNAFTIFPFTNTNLSHSFQSTTPSYHTPVVYCYQDIGFFCKIDVQLEKAVKLPVKFRLGTVQYVNKLEGKPW